MIDSARKTVGDYNLQDWALKPLAFANFLWPDVAFYRQQEEIIESVRDVKETYVVAGNKLGKDFIAGFLVLWFFLTRNPCKIITTSATDHHLDVLWGEIDWFLRNSRFPFDYKRGGVLKVNHRELWKYVDDRLDKGSYVFGMVASAETIGAMGGHHAVPKVPDRLPHSMFMTDETSSVRDAYHDVASGWFEREFSFGNAWECNNWWRKGCEDGEVRVEGRLIRKTFRIKAEDSPNVRFGFAQKEAGREPTNDVIVPGVRSYFDYLELRATKDKVWQCVALDAEWYKGAGNLLYPPEWLNYAETVAARLEGKERKAVSLGIDSGEGVAETVWCVCDYYGIMALVAYVTPDTSVIPHNTLAIMREWGIEPERVMFDVGGGGREHAHLLRSWGHPVRTVAFGSTIVLEPKYGMRRVPERKDLIEEKYSYKNRRAEMYGMLSVLLDPQFDAETGLPKRDITFGIPKRYTELRRQLAPIPKWYDEGKLYLPPKHPKPDAKNQADKVTMTSLIGCSPDEADALVLAVYGLQQKPAVVAGRAF